MLGVDGLRLRLPSEVVEVHDHRLRQRNVRLLLKREDLIHPELIGNNHSFDGSSMTASR